MAGPGNPNFKKGAPSANPSGRPSLPPELRIARKENQAAFIELVSQHWALTDEEAQKRMAGPTTRLEEAIYGMIEKAVKDRDVNAFKMMIEIMTGKIPESDENEISDEDMAILRRAKEILADRKKEIDGPRPSDQPSD